MGMFDELYCDYPLPDQEVQLERFQTKDLDQNLDIYRITKDGELIVEVTRSITKQIGQKIVGDFFVSFYTSSGGYSPNAPIYKWYEYKAVFKDGKLVELLAGFNH